MKEIEYVPKACRDKDSIIEGTVKLRIPTTVERYQYMADISIEVTENGEMDKTATQKNCIAISRSVKLSIPHYVAVSLKYRDGSGEFKSYDDMSTDANTDEIQTEIAGLILNGFRPTKN